MLDQHPLTRDAAQLSPPGTVKTENKNGSGYFFPDIEQKTKAGPLAGNDING
jgi:hypothetical protein